MLDKLVDFLISILQLFKCWLVVEPNQMAGIVLLGSKRRVVGPGFWWVAPFNADWCQTVDTTWKALEFDTQTVDTSDGDPVSFSLAIHYRIADMHKYLWEYDDACDATSVAARRVAASAVAGNTTEHFRAGEGGSQILRDVRKASRKMGIEVTWVSMVDRTKSPTLRLIQG